MLLRRLLALCFTMAVSYGQDILPLDDYITQVSFPEETEALKMELSRSNSLFKFGDSRDALYNMLYYQFYVKRINLMPKDFLQYGCQCQILSSSNVGNVAKDPLDASCVDWQQCRTCVTLKKSLKNGDNFCDPLLEMYPIGVNVTNGELSCILTTSNCQKTTCECDVKLVNELVANVDSFDQSRVLGYSFDQKRHCRRSSKGQALAQEAEQPQNDSMFRMELESLAFDDNNEKKTQQETTNPSQARPNRKLTFNSRKDADICCGEFPNVKSFNSFGGRRACCANNVYDIRKNECCDGFIKQLGTC